MKILGTLFRFLCALIVLLLVAVYLNGSLQVSLLDYLGAFAPERLLPVVTGECWLAIAAGALLLLTLCCGMKLGWNLFYSVATLVFFAEVALLLLGPEWALPSVARGLGWESALRELSLNYPVPVLLVPTFCILGCLCSSAPVRIAWTALLSCALCYGCAELLGYGVQHWQAMPEPFMPRALQMIKLFPWILFALPAVFFLQYCLFMALFETFIPRCKHCGKKVKRGKKKETKSEDKKEEEKPAAEEKQPASTATVNVTAKPVVLKRPVVHKKSPISPAPLKKAEAEEVKESVPAEEAKAEESPAEAPAPKAEEAPAEEVKAEAPKAEEAPASTEPAKEEKPAAPANAE